MLRIDILTIFPEIIENVFSTSMLKIAHEKNAIDVHLHDIRQYTTNKHKRVDDRPFGGGPGMVMCCQPVIDAVGAVEKMSDQKARLIFTGPDGNTFKQSDAQEFSEQERIIFVCGRYEGFDQRIFDILQPEIFSIGDYILTGGELAAAVMADATARLIPGVLGHDQSAIEESFTINSDSGTLLDYPHYTQPADYEGLHVPEILRGGNHKLINEWRLEKSLEKTRSIRPDLLTGKPR